MSNYKEFKAKQESRERVNKQDRQEIFENILVGIIILFLSAHLFTVHSKLLFHLNPDKLVKELVYKFDSTLFGQELIVSTIGAIAFSLITALILTIFVKYRKVFIISVGSFAFLDGVGVFIYYNITLVEKVFIISGAIYYALYTATIIISLGLFRYLKYSNEETITGRMNRFEHRVNESILETDIMELRETIQNIQNNIHEYPSGGVKAKTEAKIIHPLNDIDEEVLDEKILHLSRDKKRTQVEIAERVGISQAQVSRILAKYKNKDV